MDFINKKHLNQNTGDIHFTMIFERRRTFKQIYTLPYNTLVAVLEDGGSEASLVENQLTHEVRQYKKNHLFFTPVGLPVLYTSFESLHFIALHFNLFRYPGMDVYNGCKEWIFEKDPKMVRKIESAFRMKNPLQSLTALRACCFDFCSRHWPESEPADSDELLKMRPVLDWLHNHADACTDIRMLAEKASMSPVVFSRKFKSLFKQSPKKYLEMALTNRAIAFLSASNCKVKDAAFMLRFNSEYYFSNFFKRMTGFAPSEYKRQQMQTNK